MKQRFMFSCLSLFALLSPVLVISPHMTAVLPHLAPHDCSDCTLQCVAVCCSVLQCDCMTAWLTSPHMTAVQSCSHWVWLHCPHDFPHDSCDCTPHMTALQHTATHCNTLQHTATHCPHESPHDCTAHMTWVQSCGALHVATSPSRFPVNAESAFLCLCLSIFVFFCFPSKSCDFSLNRRDAWVAYGFGRASQMSRSSCPLFPLFF